MSVKEDNGQGVMMFKDIDAVHKRSSRTAHRNFITNRSCFIESKILLPKGFESRLNLFCQDSENQKSPVIDSSELRNHSQGFSLKYPNSTKKICSGGFKSIFVSKISTDGVFCFSQDLCPQMAAFCAKHIMRTQPFVGIISFLSVFHGRGRRT